MAEFKIVGVFLGFRALLFSDSPRMGLVRFLFSWPCAIGCLMLGMFNGNRL